VIIFINTTNIFKNHNLVLFCHGFFLGIKKNDNHDWPNQKKKNVESFYKKERKNEVWRFANQLNIANVNENPLFIYYL
jgi:hypothetical protein